MTTLNRVAEIVRQEQKKSAVMRWAEWLFCFRDNPRKYERYTDRRFNPITGRME